MPGCLPEVLLFLPVTVPVNGNRLHIIYLLIAYNLLTEILRLRNPEGHFAFDFDFKIVKLYALSGSFYRKFA